MTPPAQESVLELFVGTDGDLGVVIGRFEACRGLIGVQLDEHLSSTFAPFDEVPTIVFHLRLTITRALELS